MNSVKNYSFTNISLLRSVYFVILIVYLFSCKIDTNTNSISPTNLKVIYENDAIIHSQLNKHDWDDISCPSNIEQYNPSLDRFNCVCMQNNSWEKINSMSDIKLSNPSLSNKNFFWIQGEFYIEGNPDDYTGIYLNYVHGREIIYINNRLIAIRKISNITDIHLPTQYIISQGFLKKGKNVINLRLEIMNRRGTGLNPKIFIQHKNDFEKTRLWDNFRFKDIYGLYFITFILLAVTIIIQILIDREEKTRYLLLFSLILYIIIGLIFHIPLKLINFSLILISINSLLYVFIILFVFFFQMQYGLFLIRENKILISVLAISALLYLINGTFIRLQMFYYTLAVLTWLLSFSTAGYTLYKLNKIKPDRFKKYFFSMILITFSLITLYEFISYTAGSLYWPRQLTGYLIPVYLMMFVIYNTFESKNKRIQINQLYSQLKKIKSEKPAKLTITGTSEEKLLDVINFINENYKEDISREGLAAAINLNPNYLSSLFNAYMGKKIQEYINSLRIRDAADLVKDTDRKIIDIAYSVGFANLSTFNKAFKKETGKTPKEFRDNKGYSFIV